jgi:hypothetical protein
VRPPVRPKPSPYAQAGCDASTLQGAISKITGNWFDIQFTEPGTYTGSYGFGKIRYSGTIENVYSTKPSDVVLQLPRSDSGQAMLLIGDSSHAPNVTLKNFEFDGWYTDRSGKTRKDSRCIQVQ